jgi:hypothetical protein
MRRDDRELKIRARDWLSGVYREISGEDGHWDGREGWVWNSGPGAGKACPDSPHARRPKTTRNLSRAVPPILAARLPRPAYASAVRPGGAFLRARVYAIQWSA